MLKEVCVAMETLSRGTYVLGVLQMILSHHTFDIQHRNVHSIHYKNLQNFNSVYAAYIYFSMVRNASTHY